MRTGIREDARTTNHSNPRATKRPRPQVHLKVQLISSRLQEAEPAIRHFPETQARTDAHPAADTVQVLTMRTRVHLVIQRN